MSSDLSRRRILLGILGAGASLLAGGVSWTAQKRGLAIETEGDRAEPLRDGSQMLTRKSLALGTTVSISVVHPELETAKRAIGEAFGQLRLVDEIMSLYRPDSEVCRLNQGQRLSTPHPYLLGVLRQSESMARRTEGAFDITVQPLWSLYQAAAREGRSPDKASISATVQRVNWRQVEIASGSVRLCGRDTAITLNGIAQGFAADRVMEALQRCGIRQALVDSGEIGTLGGKTCDEAWTVGIQHPRKDAAFLSLAKLRGRCLSTSGDYATCFDSDYRDHHIFDPRSGRSPTVFSSVSIAARTATEADALSTAVFVLGVERGLQLVRDTPDADALVVFKDGGTLATEGFPSGA